MIYLFLLLTAIAYSQTASHDSAFTVEINGTGKGYLWQKSNNNAVIKIDRSAALYGQSGVYLIRDLTKGPDGYLTQKTTFLTESWQRFYLRIDSIIPGQDSIHENHLIFLQYIVSEKLGTEQPNNIVSFTIINKAPKKKNILTINTVGLSNKETLECVNFPLDLGRTYCVETRLDFFVKDSAEISFWIDGLSIGNCRIPYQYPKEEFRITISNQGWMDFCKWKLSLDEFIVSDKRIFGLPPSPKGVVDFYGNNIMIKCAPFQSTYANESAISIQSILFRYPDFIFPVYNSTDPGSIYLNDYVIPAALDSGSYLYRSRYLNNFGKWSEWTDTKVEVDKQRNINVKLNRVAITKANSKTEINTIVPDKWYDMHLYLTPKIGWEDISYTLIWLNDTSYTLGHALNKGGRFFKNSNYVLNLSMHNHNYHLYEKENENSGKSILLNSETAGKYLDGTSRGFFIDTASGHIKIRFRLLIEANRGLWSVSAVVADIDRKEEAPNAKTRRTDNFSNLFRFTVTVEDNENGKLYVLLLSLSGIIFILVIFSKRKFFSEKKDRTIAIINQKLLDYVDNNLSEKLNAEKACEDLKMRKHLFYKMLHNSGINSFPNFVNIKRIEKAKTLLKDQTKNVTEVGLAVGYENTAYFIKLFKSIEKRTPKEYQTAQRGQEF
jgi:AraC-like DNA-binding protein